MSEEKVGVLNKINFYLTDPKKFFEVNKEKSPSLIPMLIIALSAAMLQATILSVSMNFDEIAGELGSEGTGILNKVSIIFGVFTGTLGSIISLLFMSLVILIIFKSIFKAKVSFKNILSVYCYATLPNALLNIIYVFIYKGSNEINTGLVSVILRKINPITIWAFVLLIIGIAIVSNVSIKKSGLVFFVFAFLSITFTIGSYFVTEKLQDSISTDIQEISYVETISNI